MNHLCIIQQFGDDELAEREIFILSLSLDIRIIEEGK